MMSLLFSSHFAFSQKAQVEVEEYTPIPIQEQPFFNDDQLALEKAQEISDFQMRIYAFADQSNKMAEAEELKIELLVKCRKLCPNYPGINVLDADRSLIERWVLDFPAEVDFFSQVLNTMIFRLGESN